MFGCLSFEVHESDFRESGFEAFDVCDEGITTRIVYGSLFLYHLISKMQQVHGRPQDLTLRSFQICHILNHWNEIPGGALPYTCPKLCLAPCENALRGKTAFNALNLPCHRHMKTDANRSLIQRVKQFELSSASLRSRS